MTLVDRLKSLARPMDGRRNVIKDAWELLHGLPGGKAVFSKLVGRAAPYTGTIQAQVTVLRAGYSEVQMADRKTVRNHLDCVHAVALANLAELAGNIALTYSLPDDARFIVASMTIEYVKKARGTITAVGESPVPATSTRATYDVPVTLRDQDGDTVATAVLHSLVGPKKGVDPGVVN